MVDVDRNLLSCVLAMQMDLITRDDLVAAMGEWAPAEGRTLDAILIDRGALDPAARDALGPMIEFRLALHGGDPAACLASLSSAGRVAADLRRSIADPDLLGSLALATRAPE